MTGSRCCARSVSARIEGDGPVRGDGRGFVPRVLMVPAVLGLALLAVPLSALVGRVEWSTLWADVTSPEAVSALGLSLVTGTIATMVCVVLGVPLALLIARSGARVATLLRAVVTVPLVLPPMVGGVALLALLGRNGWLGALLAEVGVKVPFTTAAVVIAQTFVALPFLVLALEGSLRSTGIGYEQTAAALGAGRWRILWRVTLPLAAPGLIAGIVLCFARAIGEFGATALFAGNAPGVTQTMPLAIYTAFNGAGVSQGTAVALSLLLLTTAVAVLLLVRAWRPGAGAAR
ncbi:molybdate ABC transporter permease subunit [Microbacterium sp. 2C]|nr:molybdate ABC transporter permease subunit [Microbacterium paulum]